MTQRWRPHAATLCLLLATALGGCGLGAGQAPTGVQLVVTRDGGARVLLDRPQAKPSGADTVLRLLQRETQVTTRYGGAFVESIAGVKGGEDGWFYWVDGVAAERGAGSWTLRDGDRVWWDRRGGDARATRELQAVVGAYPAPLVGGFDGRAGTVSLECAAPERAACRLVRERLAGVGVRFATAADAARSPRDARAPVRVVVGRFDELRRFGEEASSLDGASLSAGNGVVAALRDPPRAPVWVIAGVDDQGTRRAAKALDEQVLRHRLAVVVDADGARPLAGPPQ